MVHLRNSIRSYFRHLAVDLATYGSGPDQPDGHVLLDNFMTRVRGMDGPRVLELGTRRSIPTRSTRRDDWVPNASEYLGCDIEAGPDVDVVADVHRLSDVVGEEQFDVIISCSTFEHLKYPHLAAHEVMKALKIGGVLFVHTHQTFPLHYYPYDYFRFTCEGLAGLFGNKMGFQVLATDYEYPARIFARHDLHTLSGQSYLYVRLYGEKIADTPHEYVYDYDI